MNTEILAQLTEVLRERQGADPKDSYVASLYAKGLNKILEKVGEEASEVIIAAKDHDAEQSAAKRQDLAGEVADLWFHTLVLLVQQGIEPDEVLNTLSERFGLSGHTEKAQRTR